MNESLDLQLMPMRKQAGREAPEIMRVLASAPPRSCARGRSGDNLALVLVMQGNSILSVGKQDQALEHLAKKYYKTPGSATTAMREVVNELNSLFLKRNQHLSGTGKQGTGLLAQLVLRGNQLYLAISGPFHTLLLSADEIKHLYDSDMVGKHVGQVRFPPLWFTQATLHPGDSLILAAPPLPAWGEQELRESHGGSLEIAFARLCSQAHLEVNALFIQVNSGKGALRLSQAAAASLNQADMTVTSVPDQPAIQATPVQLATAGVLSEDEADQAVELEPAGTSGAKAAVETTAEISRPGVVPNLETASTPEAEIAPEESAIPVPDSHPDQAPTLTATQKTGTVFAARQAAASIGRSLAAGLRRLTAALRNGFTRIIPRDLFKGIPSSVMVIIAIAIPVIVVAVASQVYFSLGHQARNEALFAQAVRQAEEAEKQTDMLAKKAGWENALDTLESVDESPQVLALRQQGISALDSMHLVKRLQYREALEKKLPVEINVTRLAIQGDELYMLDGNSGNVIRAYDTSAGFVVDTAFTCGPSVQGITVGGPLVDIVPWPAGFRPASEVLAVDASWNIQLCSKNADPLVFKLATPTNAAIGNLTGFALDMDDLYVLDPASNAVWIYWNNQMVTAPEEEPFPFFKDEIPVLSDVIDMVVSNEELHMLHADGHLSVCIYSGFKEIPTRCSDPTFIDFRPGLENTPMVPLPVFSQLTYTPPPEPSLYFLEPGDNAVYKFSVRSLGFQMKYLPATEPVEGGATAFGIDYINRIVYLAVGNEIYSAAMP